MLQQGRLFIPHFMGVGLALAAIGACSRGPLDSSASAPAEAEGPLSDGRIGVTLYSGAQASGAGFVDLILPDGSKQSLNAAPACTFTALTRAGSYRVEFHNQAAVQASSTLVNLSPATPSAQVALQVGGASIQAQPVAFQGSTFQFAASDFRYTVQVNQAPADAADLWLDLDPATLPPGWTYRFDQPVARGNAATNLVVTTASGSTPTTVALRLRGRVGGTERVALVIGLQRAWSLGFRAVLLETQATWNNSTWIYSCYATYAVTVDAVGLPSGQSVYLRNAGAGMTIDNAQPGGVFLPLGLMTQVTFRNSQASCAPNYANLCLDAYCGPIQKL